MSNEIQPELKDILETLHRYLAVNKNNVCFVYSMVAFKKDHIIICCNPV